MYTLSLSTNCSLSSISRFKIEKLWMTAKTLPDFTNYNIRVIFNEYYDNLKIYSFVRKNFSPQIICSILGASGTLNKAYLSRSFLAYLRCRALIEYDLMHLYVPRDSLVPIQIFVSVLFW